MKIWKLALLILIVSSSVVLFFIYSEKQEENKIKIEKAKNYVAVPVENIKWEILESSLAEYNKNVAFIDGSLNSDSLSIFLLKPNNDDNSPIFLHNKDYLGIVLNGVFQEKDSKDKKDILEPSAYWVQPANSINTLHSNDEEPILLIETQGPYSEILAEDGLNQIKSKNTYINDIVWKDIFTKSTPLNKVMYSTVWTSETIPNLNGTYIKIPFGFNGIINNSENSFLGIVIGGKVNYLQKDKSVLTLDKGSYFSSEGNSSHNISCNEKQGCIIYLRSYDKPNISFYE